MINIFGIPIRDRVNYSLANAWADKDLYQCEIGEICVIHALNIVNLDTAAEKVSSYIGVISGGLFYYHDTKLEYTKNLSHIIVAPIMLLEGDTLRVKIYADTADTPAAITFQGMRYKLPLKAAE